MRRSGPPSTRFLRTTLAGTATALVIGGALIAAPAANAAAIRPAVSATMGCVAESVGAAEGTVSCYVVPSGVAPYSVTFSATGGNIGYTDATSVIVYCNKGSVVNVTATVSDSTGASTQVHGSRGCKVGVPIP